MKTSRRPLFAALALAAAGGCKTSSENTAHCSNNGGDLYCAELDGTRPLCSNGNKPECDLTASLGEERARYGCVSADELIEGCHDPCGTGDPNCETADASSTTATGTDDNGPGPGTQPSTTASTETESGTDTEPTDTETTGPIGCDGPDECPPGRPFCEGEVCVGCDLTSDPDGACEGLDPATPVCLGETCVACTTDNLGACTETTPICNTDTNECHACTFHFECQDLGSPACHIAEGSCFDPAEQTMLDIDDGVQAAINATDPGVPHAIILTGVSTPNTITIDTNRIIAFLSSQAVPPIFTPGAVPSPTITVSGGDTVVYLHNITVSGNATDTEPGILATMGAAVYLDETRAVDNDGGGLLVETGSEAHIRNSFVGASVDDASAVVVDGGSAAILYSTLVGGSSNARALFCSSPMGVDVRNSILVTRGGTPPDEVACGAATITYSATEGVIGGMGNVSVEEFPGSPTDWFVNIGAGDFSLQNDGITDFANIAQWEEGDPPFDIDGDDRPNVDAVMDVAGADVP